MSRKRSQEASHLAHAPGDLIMEDAPRASSPIDSPARKRLKTSSLAMDDPSSASLAERSGWQTAQPMGEMATETASFRGSTLTGDLTRTALPVPRRSPVLIYRFIHQFISSRGNEYFCEIDEEYLTDRFNLTGLNTEVQYYQYALDLVTDVFDVDCDDDMREAIEKAARHLYGLVHARYIVTTRGLGKMVCVCHSHVNLYGA